MGDYDDKRKRYEDSEDEDDLSYLEDEESSDSEESGAPRRKKKKFRDRQSDLVLMEAEEDEDDEDDEEDIGGEDLIEGTGEEIGGASDNEEERKKARELFRNLTKENEQDLKEIADRYKQHTHYMAEDLDDLPVNSNEAQAIRMSQLPTVSDPTLWCVRCQEGKEREVVRNLLAKFLIGEAGPKEDRLHIFSAHCVDGDKGRFYVEARKESHVKTAVALMPYVRGNIAFKMLSRIEMPRVLVVPEKPTLNVGDWVRVKSGVYKEDLAQVYQLSQDGPERVVIRMIPRISQELLNEAQSGANGKGGAKRTRKGVMRPPARPFDPDAVNDKSAVTVGRGGDDDTQEWNGMRFRNGFLIKEIRVSSLQFANVVPTVEEVNKFKIQSKDEADSEVAIKDPSAARNVVFSKGDKIQVTKGELVSVVGVVTGVMQGNIEFRPDDTALFGKKVLSVPSSQVRKYFAVGSHVKVLTGTHAGETGVIMAVNQDEASIYSDTVHKEIKALMADLQISFSTGTGNTRLGNYDLFDLVALSGSGEEIGVIVDIEQDGFKILNENGSTKQHKLTDLGVRKNVRMASTGDAHNNYVNLGEMVRILEGPYKDLTGILKHIHRSNVFVFCTSVKENRGMISLRRHHIASIIDRNNGGGGSTGIMGAPASRPVVVGMGGPGARRIHPKMLRSEVVIIRGQWKGYKGKIKEGGGDREYRIELSSGARIVKVPKEDVNTTEQAEAASGNQHHSGGYSDRSREDLGSRTPMRINTPHHSANYYDSGPWSSTAVPPTPSRPTVHDDDFNPDYRAPNAYNNNNMVSTPAAPFTPAVGGYPGSDYGRSAPTPGGPSSYPFTPGGMVPVTPGMVPPTPGAGIVPMTPGMIPPTPGGMIPATPMGHHHVPVTPGGAVPVTPGSGLYAAPYTPVPATPMGAPPTPGGSLFPSTPGGADLWSSQDSHTTAATTDPDAWCQAGFEVYDSNSPAGAVARYVILNPNKGSSTVTVEELAEGGRNGNVIELPRSVLKLVVPQKKELVAIISTGKIGTLIGIDEQDGSVGGGSGIVKNQEDSEIQVLPMSSFAKYHVL